MSESQRRWGVLLVNLGTPEAPTPQAVRRYLGEFLWDPRVVEIPRPLWWLILNLFILQVRPRKSAKAYGAIWTEQGSPLMKLSLDLAAAVRAALNAHPGAPIPVEPAMRYGHPSLGEGLDKLQAQGAQRFLILPLYPQYAASSSGSVFDAVAAVLARRRHVPEMAFVSDYHDHPAYIEAVAAGIENHWREHGRGKYLLLSYHGLPDRSRKQGDPYYDQCCAGARLIAERLGLPENAWKLVFQSRFGAERWLQPYCSEVLKELPGQGVREVDVVCPGFAVDCLETLEEIAIANREVFLHAGGSGYRYIPALNDSPAHVRALVELIGTRVGLH